MNQTQLNDFLLKKTERQTILRERKKQLENIDVELFSSKFSRSFRNVYYFLKRLILIVLSIVLIGLGAFFYFNPETIFKDKTLKEELINDYKKEYKEMAGNTLKDGVFAVITSDDPRRVDVFLNELDKSIEKTAEKEIVDSIGVLAIVFILLGLSFLYISRLTKKLKHRNKLISKADSLTQEILRDYQLTIEEEEKELQILKDLVQNKTSTTSI
ncbi:hypothetical protein R3X25_08990 [Lutibacter sp. TH_r2]|uniref:hypothetical protein n=1 Tax=Lutibacter sp. TH_r2 TaxID=3082083 RepID=UPI0029539B27|nr:hypothetical protein [Lutibacter sp. TH_r2]MDV7187414.1 hypothetical protein [Lutibacter sp. TH_r2]